MLTSLGNFVFLRMAMGLISSGQTLQRFLSHVLRGISNVRRCIDDILIFSKTKQEHLEALNLVLRSLNDYGLVVNKEKYSLSFV